MLSVEEFGRKCVKIMSRDKTLAAVLQGSPVAIMDSLGPGDREKLDEWAYILQALGRAVDDVLAEHPDQKEIYGRAFTTRS